MKAYVAGAWVEQHQRARPMIARLREAGVDITMDWTQAEGDVCSCGHHRQEHEPFVGISVRAGATCCRATSHDGLVPCSCLAFNGIGSGGDSLLSDVDRIKYAQADLDGVLQADIVWLLAANDKGACGSWVELGAALALRALVPAGLSVAGPHIVVSGPKWKRTIFTQLADRWDEDDDLALAYIVGLHRGVAVNLDDFAKVDGVPRNVLVERIAELVAEVRQMQSEQRASGIVLCMTMRQLGEMEDNLKATQTRCTELLEQARTLLACGYPIKETT